MSEPTYQYIKGLGWQPFPNHTGVEFTTLDGHKYRLEERIPQIGDTCLYLYETDSAWVKNGKPNLEGLANYYSKTRVAPSNTHTCTATNLEYINVVWVTIVKL